MTQKMVLKFPQKDSTIFLTKNFLSSRLKYNLVYQLESRIRLEKIFSPRPYFPISQVQNFFRKKG